MDADNGKLRGFVVVSKKRNFNELKEIPDEI
jgi:hypothetical protein